MPFFVRITMNIFVNKTIFVLAFTIFTCATASSDFIIKSNQKNKVSGSKNTLKEKLGDSTKQAMNFTTELCALMGKIKIGFSENAEKFCKICQLSQMQKHDGLIQVHLSSIQSCFTDLVEDLIDNKGYFKKASRRAIGELVTDINDICGSLQAQIKRFEQLNASVVSSDKLKNLSVRIFAQFELSAKELNEVQEKVKGLKCLKKS